MTRTEKYKDIHLQCLKENLEAYRNLQTWCDFHFLHAQKEIKEEIGAKH